MRVNGNGTKVPKRSIKYDGKITSVSMEDAFWDGLKELASDNDQSLGACVSEIRAKSPGSNLSSAIRIAVLEYYQGIVVSLLAVIDEPAEAEEKVAEVA